MQDQTLGTIFVVIFPVFFVTVWVLVSYVLSLLSGWHSLARKFRNDTPPTANARAAGPLFYRVNLNDWVGYSSVIRIINAPRGMYFSVVFPFRIGHPRIFIPWDQIKISKTKRWWRNYLVLTLGTEEQIPMRISEAMAREVGLEASYYDMK